MLRNEKEPIQFLTDEIAVVSPLESEVLLIKMRGRDKQQLVKIVNAVHDTAIDKINEGERQKLLGTAELLQRTIKEKEEEIRTKLRSLAEVKKTSNSADREDVKFKLQQLSIYSSTLQQTIKSMQQKLMDVNARLETIQKKKDEGDGPSEYMILQIMQRDEGYV